jgi:hypothetical protein
MLNQFASLDEHPSPLNKQIQQGTLSFTPKILQIQKKLPRSLNKSLVLPITTTSTASLNKAPPSILRIQRNTSYLSEAKCFFGISLAIQMT